MAHTHTDGGIIAVPASHYSYAELVEIYNQTRVDYIVPMPMNAKRMQEYVENYDIDLDASLVATNSVGDALGLGMFGIRGDRGWITRLGVNPHRRERRVGSFLMEYLIAQAHRCQVSQIQLEVIVGNDPAHNMFLKFGFEDVRELLIVRRPPKPPPEGTQPLIQQLDELSEEEILACLSQRQPGASWVEETPSIINSGNLKGIRITMGDTYGWAVFQATRFQIQHIVIEADPTYYDQITAALLFYIHSIYPNRDTKVENIPAQHPVWRAYQVHGYVVTFSRMEMVLRLT